MKRIGNLYRKICSFENLEAADIFAQKGKAKQDAIIAHNANKVANLKELHQILVDRQYKTSEYITFTIFEPKERLIYRLPYFPDRIVHHAIMNVLEPIFVKMFTSDTYNCIKGKGIHAAVRKLKDALKEKDQTLFCLKLDIKKFYPSIDHDILKELLLRKFKDPDLLQLLFEIIDSADGLPIGNYLSQYLANFYLCVFDHWVKESLKVKYYFRYADDMVILSNNKAHLHALFESINSYITNLKLIIKTNWQIFPVDVRGIDFLGYRFYHTHTLLRKSIKRNFARAVAKGANMQTLASYIGWAKYCDSKNLLKKLNMKQFSELGVKTNTTGMTGEKIKVERVLNKKVKVCSFRIEKSKFPEKTKNGECLYLQIELENQKRIVFSGSSVLMDQIRQVDKADFPFEATITKEDEHFQFN